MSTAVIWSKSEPDVEFRYGGRLGEFNGMPSQSHVSHCRVLPLGEFTVMIPEPHAMHIAGCNNSIRHIENRCSPLFIYFWFFNVVWALTSGGFCIVADTLVFWVKIRKGYRGSCKLNTMGMKIGVFGPISRFENGTRHTVTMEGE